MYVLGRPVVYMAAVWCLFSLLHLGSCEVPARDDELPPTPLEDFRSRTTRGVLAVYDMSTWWLDQVIQPRTLDYLPNNGVELDNLLDGNFVRDNWQILARYAVGYFIVAIIGVLTTVGLLLAGFIVPCCRCCKQCRGGRREPRNTQRDLVRKSYRIGCGVSLLVMSCGCILGCIAIFVQNEELRNQLTGEDSAFDRIEEQINNIPVFMDTAIKDINLTIYTGAIDSKDRIFASLYKLPTSAFDVIEEETNFTYIFTFLQNFADNIEDLNNTLASANELAVNLASDALVIQTNLTSIQNSILFALLSCATSFCNNSKSEVSAVGIGIGLGQVVANISILSNVTHTVLDSNFVKDVYDINITVNNITNDVTKDFDIEVKKGENDVDAALQEHILNKIDEISDTVKEIDFSDILSGLRNVKTIINDSAKNYIYAGFIVFAAIPCLIVLLSLIGVFHGLGSPRMPDDTRCCAADRAAGADWLFAGIGVTFIFYWLLALATLTLFVTGGVFHTEACRYLVHYDEPKFQPALNMAEKYLPDEIQSYNISILSTYNSCRYDTALYTALNLAENGLNLTVLLDIIEFRNIINDIKDTPIDIPNDIVLLSLALNKSLILLDSALKIIDITTLFAELSNNITQPANLKSLANTLENLTDQPDVDNSTLLAAVAELKSLNDGAVTLAEAQKLELYRLVQEIQLIIGHVDFTLISNTLSYTQYVFNNRGKALFSSFLNTTADNAFSELSRFRDDIIKDAETNIARCYPLYNSTSQIINTACVLSLYLVNGLAFSLGWVLLFLFVGLILSFKLADHYRRSVSYEISERDEGYSGEFHPLHRAPPPTFPMGVAINPAYQPTEESPNLNLFYRPIAGQPADGAYDKRTPPPDYEATNKAPLSNHYVYDTERASVVEPIPPKITSPYFPHYSTNRVSPVDFMKPSRTSYEQKSMEDHYRSMERPW